MSDPICRWCGCPALVIDSIDDAVGRRHDHPSLCQTLLLRKLVDIMAPVWVLPAAGMTDSEGNRFEFKDDPGRVERVKGSDYVGLLRHEIAKHTSPPYSGPPVYPVDEGTIPK